MLSFATVRGNATLDNTRFVLVIGSMIEVDLAYFNNTDGAINNGVSNNVAGVEATTSRRRELTQSTRAGNHFPARAVY